MPSARRYAVAAKSKQKPRVSEIRASEIREEWGHHNPKTRLGDPVERVDLVAAGGADVPRSKVERPAPHHPGDVIGRAELLALSSALVGLVRIALPPEASRPFPHVPAEILDALPGAARKASYRAEAADAAISVVRLIRIRFILRQRCKPFLLRKAFTSAWCPTRTASRQVAGARPAECPCGPTGSRSSGRRLKADCCVRPTVAAAAVRPSGGGQGDRPSSLERW